MPRGECVRGNDVLGAIVELGNRLQPVITDVAVLRNSQELHTNSINERVSNLDLKFGDLLREIQDDIQSLSDTIKSVNETTEEHKRYVRWGKWFFGVSPAFFGSVGFFFATYWQKIVAFISMR